MQPENAFGRARESVVAQPYVAAVGRSEELDALRARMLQEARIREAYFQPGLVPKEVERWVQRPPTEPSKLAARSVSLLDVHRALGSASLYETQHAVLADSAEGASEGLTSAQEELYYTTMAHSPRRRVVSSAVSVLSPGSHSSAAALVRASSAVDAAGAAVAALASAAAAAGHIAPEQAERLQQQLVSPHRSDTGQARFTRASPAGFDLSPGQVDAFVEEHDDDHEDGSVRVSELHADPRADALRSSNDLASPATAGRTRARAVSESAALVDERDRQGRLLGPQAVADIAFLLRQPSLPDGVQRLVRVPVSSHAPSQRPERHARMPSRHAPAPAPGPALPQLRAAMFSDEKNMASEAGNAQAGGVPAPIHSSMHHLSQHRLFAGQHGLSTVSALAQGLHARARAATDSVVGLHGLAAGSETDPDAHVHGLAMSRFLGHTHTSLYSGHARTGDGGSGLEDDSDGSDFSDEDDEEDSSDSDGDKPHLSGAKAGEAGISRNRHLRSAAGPLTPSQLRLFTQTLAAAGSTEALVFAEQARRAARREMRRNVRRAARRQASDAASKSGADAGASQATGSLALNSRGLSLRRTYGGSTTAGAVLHGRGDGDTSRGVGRDLPVSGLALDKYALASLSFRGAPTGMVSEAQETRVEPATHASLALPATASEPAVQLHEGRMPIAAPVPVRGPTGAVGGIAAVIPPGSPLHLLRTLQMPAPSQPPPAVFASGSPAPAASAAPAASRSPADAPSTSSSGKILMQQTSSAPANTSGWPLPATATVLVPSSATPFVPVAIETAADGLLAGTGTSLSSSPSASADHSMVAARTVGIGGTSGHAAAGLTSGSASSVRLGLAAPGAGGNVPSLSSLSVPTAVENSLPVTAVRPASGGQVTHSSGSNVGSGSGHGPAIRTPSHLLAALASGNGSRTASPSAGGALSALALAGSAAGSQRNAMAALMESRLRELTGGLTPALPSGEDDDDDL